MRRGTAMRRQLGMTFIEVLVSAAIAAMVLGLGGALLRSSMKDSNSMIVRTSVTIRAADATDRMIRDLQCATLRGEDANDNAALDTGEDINRNGRLEADWSLADGGIASTLTFNKLQDGWLWSAPITYLVTNGRLLRRENGVNRTMCTGVQSLQFARSGDIVDIALTLTAKDRKGGTWTELSKRRASVRN